MVCKLEKSIRGLKQAYRQWYFKFYQVIILYDFKLNLVDDWIYHKFSGNKYFFLVLYVENIFLANNGGLITRNKEISS